MGGGGPLATHIDKEQAVYIIREGGDHSLVASVSEYSFILSPPSSDPQGSSRKMEPNPVSLQTSPMRRKTSIAIFASLVTVLIQSMAWLARNTQFFVHPYVLPVTVFIAVILGLSVQSVMVIKWFFEQTSWAVLALGEEFFALLMGTEWHWSYGVWIFVFFQVQLWTSIWAWVRYGPNASVVTPSTPKSTFPVATPNAPDAPIIVHQDESIEGEVTPKSLNPVVSDSSSKVSRAHGQTLFLAK